MVRASGASANATLLNRHANIAKKKPATEMSKPNPMKRSIQWTVLLPNSNGTLRIASMTSRPRGEAGRNVWNPTVCPKAKRNKMIEEILNGSFAGMVSSNI